MFNLGLLKNIKQKGALFIEYALVLAFVVVIGAFFISDGGIKNSIASIFGKAGDTIEVAVNGGEKEKKFLADWDDNQYKAMVQSIYGTNPYEFDRFRKLSEIVSNYPSGIKSTDTDAINILREAGINVPEGVTGNWIMTSIDQVDYNDDRRAYKEVQLTWVLPGTESENGNVKVMVYKTLNASGTYLDPCVGYGTATVDSNGQLNSAGNVTGFYSIRNYSEGFSFEEQYVKAYNSVKI